MTWQLIEQTETKRVWKPMNTEQRDTSHLNQSEPIKAYWKSKEGKCLACDAEIAVEDQYCPVCTEFLNEVRQ